MNLDHLRGLPFLPNIATPMTRAILLDIMPASMWHNIEGAAQRAHRDDPIGANTFRRRAGYN